VFPARGARSRPESGLSIEESDDRAECRSHVAQAAGKVFKLASRGWRPLAYASVAPSDPHGLFGAGAVYDGPVVQTQDLTVFNLTKEAVVARQAKVSDQLPPIPVCRVWLHADPADASRLWAEALIPLD